tara:strand:+ start:550 stop:996 length:447 start_codon:yes stop_codon:yes gene_type:complete
MDGEYKYLDIKSKKTKKSLIKLDVNIKDVAKRKRFYTRTIEELNRKFNKSIPVLPLKDFISMLETNNISNNIQYYVFKELNDSIKLPYFIELSYKDFKWGSLKNGYYSEEEYILKLKDILKNSINIKSKSDNSKFKYLIEDFVNYLYL